MAGAVVDWEGWVSRGKLRKMLGWGRVRAAFFGVVEIAALDCDIDAVNWRASGRIEDLKSIL